MHRTRFFEAQYNPIDDSITTIVMPSGTGVVVPKNITGTLTDKTQDWTGLVTTTITFPEGNLFSHECLSCIDERRLTDVSNRTFASLETYKDIGKNLGNLQYIKDTVKALLASSAVDFNWTETISRKAFRATTTTTESATTAEAADTAASAICFRLGNDFAVDNPIELENLQMFATRVLELSGHMKRQNSVAMQGVILATQYTNLETNKIKLV